VSDIDDRIRSALRARAGQITDADLPPSPVPAPGEPPRVAPRPRWTGRWLPPTLAAAAVIAVLAVTFAVISVVRSDHARPAHTPTAPPSVITSPPPSPVSPTTLPASPTTSPASPSTPPASPSAPPTASSAPPTASSAPPASPTSPASPTNPPAAAPFDLGYQPLWPFATLADAQEWQASNRAGGHQPWHADAAETALSFTQGFLGFSEINLVTSNQVDGIGAHVGVGYRDSGGRLHTAAVLHLVRFGTDRDSPWEVVGSDDTTFSLETPAYGSVVASPVKVGGHITGVDENIRVSVRQRSSSAPIGAYCCVPAGTGPWGATVSYSGATDIVLTIVASTGGHLQEVERFAIQGVRTR
jgi:hypothetical protein